MTPSTTVDVMERLLVAVRSGTVFDLSEEHSDADLDPGTASEWLADRQLQATVLRDVLLTADLRPDPRGLRLRGVLLTGNLDLDNIDMPCVLELKFCALERPASMKYAKMHNLILTSSHLAGLDVKGTRFAGGVFLRDVTLTGPVVASDVRISSQFNMQGACLSSPSGDALDLDGALIEGSLLLDQLHVTGSVRAIGASIGGQLNLQDSFIKRPGHVVLNLDRARVAQGAFLDRLNTNGSVSAVGAHVSGQLNLQDASLTNATSLALNLAGARIDDGAYLDRLQANGGVSISHGHVGGQLNLQDACLERKRGQALQADHLEVDNLLLRSLHRITGEINLVGASIARLTVEGAFDKDSLSKTGLAAAGWRVQDLYGSVRSDSKSLIAWLRTAERTESGFVRQPWHSLADVYDRNGQPADARKLRYAAAKQVNMAEPMPAKFGLHVYRALIGYGYYPWRTVVSLYIAFTIAHSIVNLNHSSFVLARAEASGAAVVPPSGTTTGVAPEVGQPSVRLPEPASAGTVSPTTLTVHRSTRVTCNGRYNGQPCVRPVLYALEVILPVNVAGQTAMWRPTTTWVGCALTLLKAFAWLLTALLLAAVTGLLKKG